MIDFVRFQSEDARDLFPKNDIDFIYERKRIAGFIWESIKPIVERLI